MDGLTIVSHPLVQHKLTMLRDRHTPVQTFRAVVRETAMLLCYEVTRDLALEDIDVETPITSARLPSLAGREPVIAPILRAGLGMADGMLDLLPASRLAHIGLYRDPATLEAVEYYFKAPPDVSERAVIIVDPMLATGHTAVAAIETLKDAGVTDMRFVCLICSRPGAETVRAAHPDVPIWAAGMDEELNDHGYIVPGLGDAGDRMFGTQ